MSTAATFNKEVFMNFIKRNALWSLFFPPITPANYAISGRAVNEWSWVDHQCSCELNWTDPPLLHSCDPWNLHYLPVWSPNRDPSFMVRGQLARILSCVSACGCICISWKIQLYQLWSQLSFIWSVDCFISSYQHLINSLIDISNFIT